MQYKRYGSSYMKKCGLSPDAIAQLAMQVAFHRVTGRVPAVTETCSTAMFKQGCTEFIRSATLETKRCTEAFYKKSGVSSAEKRALVKDGTITSWPYVPLPQQQADPFQQCSKILPRLTSTPSPCPQAPQGSRSVQQEQRFTPTPQVDLGWSTLSSVQGSI
ncbi:carnitine O-palmitoyltransferase 2, mitochondrial-like [Acanthaster planci]|uniref:Carnitine O-palmitoyltransferase 2, mitochondrial-like n=1 Tax=Acanthaster planci TaxID=133434 RepID=A0A8B7ZQY7_ACAPL|nr:carnitine O-palmitoyltransferase 2, mitochondrial-like [Acanthaster planci]